jgi:hypothetical protein
MKTKTATKTCSSCNEDKNVSEFYKRPESKDGLYASCKACHHERTKKWRARNPEKVRSAGRTRYQNASAEERKQWNKRSALSAYGLTLEEYTALLAAQNGVCAICGLPEPSGKDLAVDHDHATGKVRGLLCANCNQGLGRFKDDPHVLKAALRYLRGQHG